MPFIEIIKAIMHNILVDGICLDGIGIGILIAIIPITKVIKTSSQDVLKMNVYCRKCGLKINGPVS
ncbi:MAG: hypothetical protein ACR2LL_07610 [Nitrosopumilus sp.]|uniref:hypothetical protein n=1 Tax=Nitrosopumilus sp. TaxID=2024843 RepID=UPI0029307C06|nr:hypothetical protein [Nitrosopumilus sp.]